MFLQLLALFIVAVFPVLSLAIDTAIESLLATRANFMLDCCAFWGLTVTAIYTYCSRFSILKTLNFKRCLLLVIKPSKRSIVLP
jgi:hypothetical protein